MARSTQPKVNVVVDLPKRERPRNLWAMLLGRARQMPRRGASNAARRPNPFEPAVPPPGVVGDGKPKIPQIAMDAAKAFDMAADQGPEGVVGSPWVGGYGAGYFASAYAEGQEWLGYAVLALLSQRPEYRVMTDTYATEMTREWIEFKSKSEDRDKQPKINELKERLDELRLKQVVKAAIENDGFQGRGQIYIDTGDDDPDELKSPIGSGGRATQAKFGRDGMAHDFVPDGLRGDPDRPPARSRIRGLAAIEPMWCFPSQYNADDPLKPDWYRPEVWWVMGREVHRSRLLTFISNPVPNMLMPAYSFGGLSRTQMAKPYVDFWLRNRTSSSDLLNNFAQWVLSTDLGVTTMDEGSELLQRVLTANVVREGQGIFVVNKESEEVDIKAAPLGGVKDLVGQSAEHMTVPNQIPIVKFFGNQPSGLNADSEGVIRLWYDRVHSLQESLIREPIQTIVDLVQVELWGEADDDIEFEFVQLWQLDEAGKAAIQLTKSQIIETDISSGIVTTDEARLARARDPDSIYAGLDLHEPLPEPEIDPLGPEGGGEQGAPQPGNPKPETGTSQRLARGVESQAAEFGGAATGGFSAHDGSERGVPFDLASDKWEEHLHPRSEAGKFAPKGTVAPGHHALLTEKGFAQHPESPHAIYTHPSGHQVAFKPFKNTAYNSAISPTPPAASKPVPPPVSHPPSYQLPTAAPSMSHLSAAAPQASSAQSMAVSKYTDGAYGDWNRSLRMGLVPQPGSGMAHLTDWLEGASFPEDRVVVRKISADYAKFIKEMPLGSEFVDHGFMSTSAGTQSWGGEVTMEIRIPKGSRAASVQHLSSHYSEFEVVVQRGSRLKVVDVGSDGHMVCELSQPFLHKIGGEQ